MSVDSVHPEYKDASTGWKKMRDTVAGMEAIHKAGKQYLPELKNQTTPEYDAYKGRALFLAATGRTVDSLNGMVFRKPVEIEVPASMNEWVEDITASGVSAEQLCRESLNELTTVGRYGLMIDYPQAGEDRPTTLAGAEQSGFRPRVKQYMAEHIVNWKTGSVNNEEMLTMVVLKEMVPAPKDEFDTTTKIEQYRVLDLESVYRQRVFQKEATTATWTVVEEFWPTMSGQRMNFIPFLIYGIDGESVDVDIPPLNDLADINLSHYKFYADYANGLHFTGLPTPVLTGVDQSTFKDGLTIGSAKAWLIPQPDAKAYFLEFEGKGLDQLAGELDNLEKNMAIFGAKLLRESKKVAEAAETAAINRAGEASLLASWAAIVGESVQKALEIMRDWAGLSGDISVSLNKDFMPIPMDSAMLRELVASWQAGAISFETLYMNLQRGEVASEDRSAEDEQDMVDVEGPSMEVE